MARTSTRPRGVAAPMWRTLVAEDTSPLHRGDLLAQMPEEDAAALREEVSKATGLSQAYLRLLASVSNAFPPGKRPAIVEETPIGVLSALASLPDVPEGILPGRSEALLAPQLHVGEEAWTSRRAQDFVRHVRQAAKTAGGQTARTLRAARSETHATDGQVRLTVSADLADRAPDVLDALSEAIVRGRPARAVRS